MNGKPRAFYLPRLSPEFYRGPAAVHWTVTMFDRETGWLDKLFHSIFREMMLHVAARESLFCPAYCLMPDHFHLIWMGLHQKSDQRNGMKFLRQGLAPILLPYRFQRQAHDHVLRGEDRKRGALAKTCFYILANPVRAGLSGESDSWPYCGALVPGYPDLHPLENGFWPLFWKLYERHRHPAAGESKLPLLKGRNN